MLGSTVVSVKNSHSASPTLPLGHFAPMQTSPGTTIQQRVALRRGFHYFQRNGLHFNGSGTCLLYSRKGTGVDGGGGHYKKPPYNASTVQVRTYCTLCTLKNISFIATLAKSLNLRQGNYHRTVRVCYCTPSSIFKYKQTRNNNQVG